MLGHGNGALVALPLDVGSDQHRARARLLRNVSGWATAAALAQRRLCTTAAPADASSARSACRVCAWCAWPAVYTYNNLPLPAPRVPSRRRAARERLHEAGMIFARMRMRAHRFGRAASDASVCTHSLCCADDVPRGGGGQTCQAC